MNVYSDNINSTSYEGSGQPNKARERYRWHPDWKGKNKTGFTHRSRRNLMQATKKERDTRVTQWVIKTAGYTISRQKL